MADDVQQAASGKTRTRSPSYPAVGLEEAIRRVRLLYDEVHDHKVGMEAVAPIWETNTKSSAFLQGISALKQFGLLADAGKGEVRQVSVSGRAMDILIREEGSPERIAAIKAAALAPSIHGELWTKYSGHLPPSDAPIRVYLLRERQAGTFHPDHVDAFISQFRSTIAFANLTPDDTIPCADEEVQVMQSPSSQRGKPFMQAHKNPVSAGPTQPVPPQPQSQNWGASSATPYGAAPHTPMRELPITLPSSLSVAVFRVPEKMNELDFKTLVNSLNAMKDALVSQPDPKPQ